ncbi:hypothetical protein P3396_23110, partial [Vibrio parahaemolyticus]|nr:hypothetical protein [Vibrio parahaemolyticus]
EGETERDAGEMIMTVAYNNINESNNIKIIILAIVVQYVELISDGGGRERRFADILTYLTCLHTSCFCQRELQIALSIHNVVCIKKTTFIFSVNYIKRKVFDETTVLLNVTFPQRCIFFPDVCNTVTDLYLK